MSDSISPSRFATNGDNAVSADLTSPIVRMDSRVRLFSDIRRKLFPGEIRGILAGALMGNLWYQEQLFIQMADSWPRLQKNLRCLTDAVSRVNYIVSPFKEEGQKTASPKAIEKANTVKRAIWGMRPIVTRAEQGFEGLLKSLVESTLTGFSVNEILWELRQGPKGHGMECMPRAAVRVPSLYYRYPMELDVTDELLLNPSGELGGIDSCLKNHRHNWLKICRQRCQAASRRLTMSWMAWSAL